MSDTASEPPSDATGFWEGRYGERDQVWSGEPNAALVETTTGMAPGRALDLGCGEGADSVWLAGQGWQVTAVDISATAIRRARTLAATRSGAEAQITWLVEDLATWEPTGTFELVSSCFLHSPVGLPRGEVLRRAATHVAPAGHLLVVAHAEAPPWARERHHDEHAFPGPAEELDSLALDSKEWEVTVSEVRTRAASDPDGAEVTLRDTVTLLRRRAR